MADRTAPKNGVFSTMIWGLLWLAALGPSAFGVYGLATNGPLARFEYWWLATLGPGLLFTVMTWRSNWRLTGLVMASFFIGLATQQALRDPIWFQHVRMRPSLMILAGMGLAMGAQALLVLWVLWTRKVWRQIWPLMRGFGLFPIALVLSIMLMISASMMQQISLNEPIAYARQLVIAWVFLGLNVLSFMALLAVQPAQGLVALKTATAKRFTFPGATSETAATENDRMVPRLFALGAVVLCGLIATMALEAVPHLDDVIYLFQARYLADGQLTLPIPPVLDAFDHYLIAEDGTRWFATTFPGWPAALAMAQLIGLEFWLSPVLAGLCVLLLHRIVSDLIDRGTAHIAAILLAVSPWFIMTASNPMIHTFTVALILGSWALLLNARQRPSLIAPFFAGLLMGWMFLSRPLDGVVIGTLTGLVLLPLLKDWRHLQTIIAYGLGCIVLASLIFLYNIHLTGEPFVHALNIYIDDYWGPGQNDFGFGANRGAVPDWGTADALAGHSPLEALINAHQNLHEVNSSFLGWGGASILFMLIYFVWGQWTRFTAFLAVICLANFALYSLYWYYGGFYIGARYWFLMLVPFVVFTALGLRTAARKAAEILPKADVEMRLGTAIAFLCAVSIFVFASWIGVNRFPEANDYHDDYKKLATDAAFENALVFINLPEDTIEAAEYGSAFWLNDFNPGATTPLFARNLGPDKVLEIARHWPDRTVYFVDGRSNTVDKVTIVDGPLALTDLEAASVP